MVAGEANATENALPYPLPQSAKYYSEITWLARSCLLYWFDLATREC